jgi:hypothetical protein
MLIGRIWQHGAVLGDGVARMTHKRAIKVAHEQIAWKKRTDLSSPDQDISLVSLVVMDEVMLMTLAGSFDE